MHTQWVHGRMICTISIDAFQTVRSRLGLSEVVAPCHHEFDNKVPQLPATKSEPLLNYMEVRGGLCTFNAYNDLRKTMAFP